MLSSGPGVQDIENRLDVLTEKNLALEHGMERVELLTKKKAWLEFDEQNKRINSLRAALSFLEGQLKSNDERLQSIVQKIAVIREDSPLRQV